MRIVMGRKRQIDTHWFRGKSLDGLLKELLVTNTLDEAYISTRVSSKLEAKDGFLHSQDLGRICPGDDNLDTFPQ